MNVSSLFKKHVSLGQHLLAALSLTAVSLAVYSIVDYGNAFGIDDWAHFYNIYHNGSPSYSDRPLALLLLQIISPVLTTNFLAYHFVLLALRVSCSILVYTLIRQVVPQRPFFAFTCALVACVFIVRDSFFLIGLLLSNDVYLSVTLTLLALNIHTAYMQSSQRGRLKPTILLIVSLALAFIVPLVREATLPVLFAIPILIFMGQRQFSRARLFGLFAWCVVVVGASLHYALPTFGIGQRTYGSDLLVSFDLTRLYWGSVNQFDFAFRSLFQLDPAGVYQNLLPVTLTVSTVLLGFFLARSKIKDQDEPNQTTSWLAYLSWLAGGLIAAWLGFAAYLPSIYAQSPTRTHALSIAGEAIALTSAIGLLSRLGNRASWRLMVQVIGLVFITAYGATTIANSQAELYGFAANWENLAYFMRSLGHLAPAVQKQTLFVYIENKNLEETPFVSGFSFQYAIRYFYNDTATGLMPSDNILGAWQVSDSGINVEEKWIDEAHLYKWNEIIFITRENSGRLLVLETLPNQFYNPNRQALYRPYARIQTAFISTRIRDTFPALSGPDWSGHDFLLQNKAK